MLAEIEPLKTIKMIRVAEGVAAEAVATSPLITTPGVPTAAKKPDGYDNVMAPPAASAPPADVAKVKVAATPGLLTTRSALATRKPTEETAPPITPDAAEEAECNSSALVATETLSPDVGMSPKVIPVTNTVT